MRNWPTRKVAAETGSRPVPQGGDHNDGGGAGLRSPAAPQGSWGCSVLRGHVPIPPSRWRCLQAPLTGEQSQRRLPRDWATPHARLPVRRSRAACGRPCPCCPPCASPGVAALRPITPRSSAQLKRHPSRQTQRRDHSADALKCDGPGPDASSRCGAQRQSGVESSDGRGAWIRPAHAAVAACCPLADASLPVAEFFLRPRTCSRISKPVSVGNAQFGTCLVLDAPLLSGRAQNPALRVVSVCWSWWTWAWPLACCSISAWRGRGLVADSLTLLPWALPTDGDGPCGAWIFNDPQRPDSTA